MYDWFDKLMIALTTILGIVVVGGLIFAIVVASNAEPTGEEFDVVGWVANPANPCFPTLPKILLKNP